MSSVGIAIIVIIVMLALICLGVNIGMVMYAAGFLGFAAVVSWSGAFGLLRTVPFTSAFNYAFTVIPMFILMGQFAFNSGMSSSLYDTAEKWLGGIRGGLSVATIAACAGFSTICGSTAATAATMGVVAYPEMKKFGYSSMLSSGSIAAGGTLGILIPPSTGFIFYSIITEQSVGAMFAAGVIPGIVLSLCYILAVSITVRIKPDLAPQATKHTWMERLISLKGCIGIVIIFVIVLGGIFGGIFSVNEAAAFGAFCSLLFMIANGRFTWAAFKNCLANTVSTTAMSLFIVCSALLFGNFMTISRFTLVINDFILSLQVNRYIVVLIIFLIYLALGSIMDGLALMFLTVPIFFPIMISLGFSPIWYGVFLIMVCEIALMTPPVGLNVYVVAGVLKEVPLQTIFKGVVPFVLAAAVAVAIITAFPGLTLWLPTMLYG